MKMRWLARRLRKTDNIEDILQWVNVVASLSRVRQNLNLSRATSTVLKIEEMESQLPWKKCFTLSPMNKIAWESNDVLTTIRANKPIPVIATELKQPFQAKYHSSSNSLRLPPTLELEKPEHKECLAGTIVKEKLIPHDIVEPYMDIEISSGQDIAVLTNKRDTVNRNMTSTRIDIGSKAVAKKTEKNLADMADMWVKGALGMMERDNTSRFEEWDDSQFWSHLKRLSKLMGFGNNYPNSREQAQFMWHTLLVKRKLKREL